jgi:AAA+ ATPase superfamily predicted ATPase
LKSLSAEPFFLSPAVNVLVSLAQQIHEAIPLDNISHSSLDDARTSLEMLREKANNLVQPEREIQLQIIEHWVQIVSAARYAFLRENPYVVGRPIDPQSGAQFFGRKDIFNWISDNLYGGSPQNILVFHGERRMGKTSILLQLLRGDLGREMRERAKRSLCPIYIDLQNFNDSGTAAFLRKFAKEINRQIQNQGIQVPELEQFEKLPYDTFDDFIASICSLHQQRQLILMLDEFERLDSLVSEGMLDKNIFAQLRTLMQFKQNLSFLFAGTHELGELSPEYCELLRSIALVQEVGFLDEFDSRALIQEPVAGKVNYAPNATSEIYRLTHGHPYLIQWLCHDLIDGMNKRGEGNYITQNHVVSCAQQFVSKRDVYLRDLWTSSSEIEKAILRTLANAPIGTAAPIIYGGLVAFPTEAVEFGFSRLEKRGLIEQNPAESNLYIHSILLFSNWITQNPRLL